MREFKRGQQVLLALAVVALGVALHRVLQDPVEPTTGPRGRAATEGAATESQTATGAERTGRQAPATTDAGQRADVEPVALLVARVEAALERPRGVELSGQVLGASREPLVAAQVEALRLEVRSLVEGPRPVVLQRATTDADGRFLLRLEGRASEALTLRLRHDEHALRHLPLGPLPERGARDLGNILLDRGSVAHGVVRDEESGAPIAGARLSFLPEELVGQPDAMAVVAETDEHGRFEARGIGSDLVRVQVEAKGHARARMAMVSLLRQADERNAMTIHLVGARILGGHVRDRFGASVPEALVKVERIGALSTCEATTRSGPGGAFRFPDLEQGYYVVKVRHPTHAEFVHLRAHTGVEDLELRLDPLGSVAMSLPDLPQDRPVPLAVVPVHAPTRQARLPALILEANGGQLLVEGLEPGSWSLELRVPGTAPSRTATFEVFSGRQTRLGIVRLDPPASIQGRVVDGDARPLRAEAALCSPFLRETLAARRSLFQLADRRVVFADEDGHFVLEDLAGGVTALAIRATGHQPWRALELEVPAGGTLDLGDVVLEPAATLSGQATTPGGAALAGVLVELKGVVGSQQTTTDAGGHYEFRDLAPGRYTVSVPVIGRGDGALEQALAPQDRVRHTVQLTPGEVTRRDLVMTAPDQRLP